MVEVIDSRGKSAVHCRAGRTVVLTRGMALVGVLGFLPHLARMSFMFPASSMVMSPDVGILKPAAASPSLCIIGFLGSGASLRRQHNHKAVK